MLSHIYIYLLQPPLYGRKLKQFFNFRIIFRAAIRFMFFGINIYEVVYNMAILYKPFHHNYKYERANAELTQRAIYKVELYHPICL